MYLNDIIPLTYSTRTLQWYPTISPVKLCAIDLRHFTFRYNTHSKFLIHSTVTF